MSWNAIWVALLGFLNKLVGALPLIALWIANKKGESTGIDKAESAQTAQNAEVKAEFEDVATQGMSDKDVDDKLDKGTF